VVSALAGRASRRYFSRHPWQLALTVIGVALGVAVVVAVDLANESAERAFRLATDTAVGQATHQIVGGPGGLDERLYTRLRVELGLQQAAPVIEGWGRARGETLQLLGVDPFAESGMRGHLSAAEAGAITRLLTTPNGVLMADVTAARLGIAPGNGFAFDLAGRKHELTLLGTVRTDATTRAGFDGVVISDIATAQELLGFIGRLSAIDLTLPAGTEGDALVARIRTALPPSAELLPAASRGDTMAQMTRAFRTNLTAMSLLALLVGMFLIYNTMTFAVLQRRSLIGTLRALGVTRAQIFGNVLGEGLAIGTVGAALGLLVGVALGQGLVRLVTRTINDLYFVVTVSDLLVTPAPLIKGFALGLLATVAAVAVPAYEAATTAPRLTLTRSVLEARVRALAPRLALSGLVLAAAALLLLWLPSRDLVVAFVALFMLLLGLTFLAPLAVYALAQLPTGAGTLLGTPARLALRGVAASLSRTGVAIAALMLAVATTVGVGVMVASFRASVAAWLETTLRADVFVTAPGVRSHRTPTHLDPRLLARLRAIPGVAEIATGRAVTVESRDGLSDLFAIDIAPAHAARFQLLAGDRERAFTEFFAGRAVLVSEPYAWRRALEVGDTIELRTDRGPRPLPVLAIYRDYGSDQGEVLLHRRLYDALYDDREVTTVGLYLQPGMDPTTVIAAVRRAAAGTQDVLVRSSRELSEVSLAVFDRTFTITNVLRMLAVLAALIGILSALMALSLERARELGVLRALGFTPGQIGAVTTVQTGFMGLAAGLLALPVGAVLALLLIHVINRRAFGWSMDTIFPPAVFGEALLLAVGAALLAGLYPAWKMSRAVPAEILREE
jgi:putative ABC transport system permease protein